MTFSGLISGMTGMVVLDSKGDREPDYWITDMAPNGTFVKIAEVLNTNDGERVRLLCIIHSQDSFLLLQAPRLSCALR